MNTQLPTIASTHTAAEPSNKRDRVDWLADRIALISAAINAATHEQLTAIREFDQTRGWHRQGALSCAAWLSWRIGMSLGPARERVRVANKLGELPLVDEALRHGTLSYSQVRAITRVATADNEKLLLRIARHSTAAQLERVCRRFRGWQRRGKVSPEDTGDLRWVSSRKTDEGMVRIQIQLPPEEAATVLEAMRVSAETRDRADGVVAMAEAAVAGEGARAGKPPVEVMVHVDAATLNGDTEAGDGIPAETCRRLLCDAGVVPTLEDDTGRILDVGKKKRTIPPALRRALKARDGGCRFPGCANTICDAHHIEHWLADGETTQDNLLLLCRQHHRHLHEYGFRVELDADGTARFYDRHDRLIPETGELPRPSCRYLERRLHTLARLGIDEHTTLPAWDGKVPQYHRVVDSLIRRHNRTRGQQPAPN